MPSKTEELPGVEGAGVSVRKIKRLDNAIAAWRETVAQRMELTENEVIQRAKVQEIMVAENLKTYAYWVDDETQKDVVLDSTVKVKMKKHKDADAESDEEPEPEEQD